MKTLSKTLVLPLALAASMMASCTQTGNNNTKTDTQENTSSQAQQQVLNQAKAVFYQLPSPVETGAVLETLGVTFNGDMLNKPNNVEKYNTTSNQAMNLGIYTADLSFCALYDQNQSVIDYLAAIKKLAEQLGIVGFFNDSTITKIQDNINNKNMIVGIISDSYSRSTGFLEEQERSEIASTVIVGGWLESLYITCKTLKEVDLSKNNQEVSDIIHQQQYTMEDLMGMLSLFHSDNNIAKMESQVGDVHKVFAKYEQTDTFTKENINELDKVVDQLRAMHIE